MKLEHVALNVKDPVGMAAWYVQHLGFRLVKRITGPPYAHFIVDSAGAVMLEIYLNPPGQVPAYAERDPLVFHLAFIATDAKADEARFLAAGATLAYEEPKEDGSMLIMMRDPWGIPFQLCQRAQPLLGK